MTTPAGLAARSVPVLLAITTTVLAFQAGVGASERDGVAEAGLLVQLYYAIGLFFLGGLDLGVPEGGPDAARLALWVTYFASPAITTTAVVEGALRLADPTWLRRALYRDHTLVVGDGRLARVYADVVRAADGRKVLTVPPERLARRPADLAVDRAHAVILVTDHDLHNLGMAWELKREHPSLRVVAHVAELSLRRGSTPLAEAAGVELFNTHEITAAAVFEHTLRPHFVATPQRDVVAIVGFGRFGQTVMRHLQQHAAGQVAHIVLVDREASRLARQYREQIPLDPACTCSAVDADARDPGAWQQLAERLAEHEVVPVVLLATNDDATNLQAAVGMRRRLPSARLFVRCFHDSAYLRDVERAYDVEGVAVERILDEALRSQWGRRG